MRRTLPQRGMGKSEVTAVIRDEGPYDQLAARTVRPAFDVELGQEDDRVRAGARPREWVIDLGRATLAARNRVIEVRTGLCIGALTVAVRIFAVWSGAEIEVCVARRSESRAARRGACEHGRD